MSVTPGPGEHAQRPAPPAGEEIHLPGPTILPLVTAIAITFIVIGSTLGWWLSIVGAVILIVCVIRWIRDTRRDIDALPEQHH
jgi:Flp pilus assembly protein TadB